MTLHWLRRTRPVALGLMVLLVVGCTAGADPAADLDLESVSGDGFTIDVPQDWEASDPDERLVPGRALEYLPAGSADLEPGTVPPQIGVALDQGGESGPVGDLEGYVTLLFGAGPALGGESVEIVERREVDVDGVEQAMRVEVSHPAGEDTVRMKVLLLRTAEGPIWDVRYAATEDDFDDALAEAVLDSFALEAA